jgi:hypothetical protein
MIKDIGNDIDRDGLSTLTALITVYAPPNENNTQAYINQIASWTGIEPYQSISNDYDSLQKIIPAMARYENGVDCITPEIFNHAYSLL